MSVGLSGLAAVYMIIWTIMDAPEPQASLQVTSDENEYGETVVLVSSYCDSESKLWQYIAFTMQALLLICASVLAFQMRQVPNEVNDSKPLAFMIYTSFFFLTLRFVLFVVSGASTTNSSSLNSPLQKCASIFISLDTIANILIFFTPFFAKDETIANLYFFFSGFFMKNEGRRTVVIRQYNPDVSVIGSSGVSSYGNGVTSSQSQTPAVGLDRYQKRSSMPAEPATLHDNDKNTTVKFAKEEGAVKDKDGNPTTIRIAMKDENEMIDIAQWVIEEYGTKVKLP